ncbi:MAG: hypothetical protein SGCHY_002986 [Lobulomycetales sp.]
MSRASQLESVEINDLLVAHLTDQCKSVIPAQWTSRLEPEIRAVLLFLLSYPTPVAARLLHLTYDRTHRSLLHSVSRCVADYLFARFAIIAAHGRFSSPSSGWQRFWTWRTMQVLEKAYKAASLVNAMLFLRNGEYMSLPDRLFSKRLVRSDSGAKPGALDYEFLNRQLAWNAATDFCALVVPLINFTKLSNRVSRAVSWIMPSAANGSHESRSALADDICLICVAREGSGAVGILAEDCRAYNPYETSCRHVFCYYCINLLSPSPLKDVNPLCSRTRRGMENRRHTGQEDAPANYTPCDFVRLLLIWCFLASFLYISLDARTFGVSRSLHALRLTPGKSAGVVETTVHRIRDGLSKVILEPGDGANFPRIGQSVSMLYSLHIGERFIEEEKEQDRSHPFKTRIGVGQVIRGWDIGVPTMSVGERSRFTMAPEFAYGKEGSGENVPGNSTLTFVIDLLKIS